MMSAAVSALMVSGALAQANPPASAPAAETHSPNFIQAQGTEKLVFSKFKGSSVLGPDNQKVGSVTDMLFDRNGKIDGLIVGVGGFLGIGEKNVAIDMSAFQMVPAASTNATTGTSSTGTSRTASAEDPTHVNLKVTWTKDELKAAPDFQYYRPVARMSDRPSSSPTTGMGPRPMTPPPPAAPQPR
jgi:hypothetical protein